METPSSMEGEVGFALQSVKGTAAAAFFMALLTKFKWTPDVVTDEGEPELGGDLDVGPAERFGNKGATFEGEARLRPGHLGLVLRGYGMQHRSGGFIFWDGVNDQVKVTDGGGTATIDIITNGALVAGTPYTGAQVATTLQTALNANATLEGTYTVSFSTTTNMFTIAASGTATLSLIWTDTAITKMFANLLGYDHSADDTSALTYTSDEARDVTGRWSFRDSRNDTIRVTDAGGGPVDVDILAGTGAVLATRVPYSAWNVAAGLKAVLDGNATLTGTYTVTYSVATHKFTVATSSGSLSLHWSHTNSNLEDDLGFASGADDTSAVTYTADYTIWPAARHRFTPYQASSSFGWLSILDKFDQDTTLDTRLRDARVNRVAIQVEADAPIKMTFGGRALYYADAVGSETETAESTSIGTPNSDDGQVNFGSVDDYPMASLNFETSWQEEVEPHLGHGSPRSVTPKRRSAKATCGIYFGAETDGGLFRAAFYGSPSGTAPSNTIVSRAVDALFQSGTPVSGALGAGQANDTADYYGIRVEAPEAQLMPYDIEKSGDNPVRGDLAVHISRRSTDWGITLINNEDRSLYA